MQLASSCYSSEATLNFNLLPSSLSQKIKIFKMEDIKNITNDFNSILYENGLWTIYNGKFDKVPVAIKRFKARENEGFEFEMMNLVCCHHHPHILNLIGVSYDVDLCLVLEFVLFGTLQDSLDQKEGSVKLKKEEKLKIIIDISDTLVYLHFKKLLHRDIKPSNILINRHKMPKLSYLNSNFHLYQDFNKNNIINKMASLAYTCPVWMETGHYGTFTDMYGLGMTMLSLMAEDTKPNEIKEELDVIIENKEYEKLKSFFAENWDFELAFELAKLGYECIKSNVAKRPSAFDFSNRLKAIYNVVSKDLSREIVGVDKIDNLVVENSKLLENHANLKIKNFKLKALHHDLLGRYMKRQQDKKSILKEKAYLGKLKRQYEVILEDNKLKYKLLSGKAKSLVHKDVCYVKLHKRLEKGNISEKQFKLMEIISRNSFEKEGESECFDVKLIKSHFSELVALYDRIEFFNVEELELCESLIFTGIKFDLTSNIKINLKIDVNTTIIIKENSNVRIENFNIVECEYGGNFAILIEKDSLLEMKHSFIKRNSGTFPIMGLRDGSTLVLENVIFNNNSSKLLPVCIYARDCQKIKLIDCQFMDHDITEDQTLDYWQSAIIKAEVTDLYIDNSYFGNNNTQMDGFINVIFAEGSENVEINNTKFFRCVSSRYMAINRISIKNCTFHENMSLGEGGALTTIRCGNVTIFDSKFKYNSADKHKIYGFGGSVAMYNCNTHFNKCILEGNYSNLHGGALAFSDGKCELKACEFKNNDSKRDGYDIFNQRGQIRCDEQCTFVSEIGTHSNIRVFNWKDGLFNYSGESVNKKGHHKSNTCKAAMIQFFKSFL